MLRERPEARASIVTASIFAEKFADASERDLLEEFQKSYHDLDLLVLEDLQHLVRQRDAQRQLIHNGAGEQELRNAARAAGMRSMREDGERWIAAGETSPEEVVRVTRDV